MKIAEPDIATLARRVISRQLLTTLFVAALFLWQGAWAAISVILGGLISVFTAWLLSLSVRRANQAALTDPKKSTMILYMGSAQRFIAVIVLMAFAIAVIGLLALPTCVGFAVAQLSFLISSKSVA